MYFATDTPDSNFEDSLIQELLIKESKGENLYALIDLSFCLLKKNLISPDRLKTGAFIYSGTSLEELKDASPYIFPLSKQKKFLERDVKKTLKMIGNFPMVSFLSSNLDLFSLREILTSHIELCVENDQKFIFRFGDTRILASVDAVFSQENVLGWKQGISSWIFSGRDGSLSSLDMSKKISSNFKHQHLDVTQEILNKIIENSEVDAIIDTIYDQNSSIMLGRKNSDIYFLVKRVYEFAREKNIENFRDLVAFCTTALATNESFYKHPEFKRIISSAHGSAGKLSESFLALDDDIWTSVSMT